MKKYKYQRLSKDEKKEAKKIFYQTEQGIELKKRFNRILILFGIYLLVEAYIKKDSYAQYVYGSILILFGIGFLISRGHVKMMKVNDFITRQKNTTKK